MSIVRTLFAGAASLAVAGAAQATTLTTSYSTWVANAGRYDTTTTDPDYNPFSLFPATTSSIALTGGGTLTLSPGGAAILETYSDLGPWVGADGSNYYGIVYSTGGEYDTVGKTETLSIPAGLSAFAVELQPSGAAPGGFADTFTVTLSDGKSTQISELFDTGTTAFVGYYGGYETSMTISVENSANFAFGDIRDVPEPGSLALLASGTAFLGLRRRRA